jgi:hypothetical protein
MTDLQIAQEAFEEASAQRPLGRTELERAKVLVTDGFVLLETRSGYDPRALAIPLAIAAAKEYVKVSLLGANPMASDAFRVSEQAWIRRASIERHKGIDIKHRESFWRRNADTE